MGFLSSIFWGGVVGTLTWAYLPSKYYKPLERNVGTPVQQEYSKDVVDMTKIFKIVIDGTVVSIKEMVTDNKK